MFLMLRENRSVESCFYTAIQVSKHRPHFSKSWLGGREAGNVTPGLGHCETGGARLQLYGNGEDLRISNEEPAFNITFQAF